MQTNTYTARFLILFLGLFFCALSKTDAQNCYATPKGLEVKTSIIDENTNITLTWNKIGAINSYEVRYKLADSGSWEVEQTEGNRLNLGNLAAKENYEWQVKAICSSTSSGYSTSQFFYVSEQNGLLSQNQNIFTELKETPSNKIIETEGDHIYLSYQEKFLQKGTTIIRFYNWKHQLIQSVCVQSHLGQNQYNFDLTEISNQFSIGDTYIAEAIDFKNNKKSIKFRYTDKIPGPTIDLIINPIQASCEITATNEIEFYADIVGGKPEYTATWVVSSDLEGNQVIFTQTDKFQETYNVRKTGSAHMLASKITVTLPLDYYVTLLVSDICGNKEKKVARISCDQDENSQMLINNINNTNVQPNSGL